ncbi:bifunctional hydroxymethylpyrimidine kinase/phosphomethylpyrimidine kinase [Flavobacterium cerinum]|uniref:hydroxymethylpyrimidine kinase n=1 Tax=Flavobacterium cerinum TaxID=2502784 RepID=A0ABY5IT25_9FLAO|nr:bifunctional hydroxymethylpyrimidine kinase/phosphomethylpyrimidine kinase [Flavobacterium cerinum]UUC44616.1 bifunctional hydroxymethylpyrimidine kinase/phosphomethylpyrimidine kinase [Flavobacterium cerinum]
MKKEHIYPVVLTIAGFDGSGGAGIQADIKTISALGCYATSVLTALPVQNTCGVKAIHTIPTEIVQMQLQTIMEDIRPDAIKIGMVHSLELVRIIAEMLQEYPEIPVVFDPVMVATSGHRLIKEDTINEIVNTLFPLSTIITPNLDEAAVLTGAPIGSVDEMRLLGTKIMEKGCQHLLLKGGHLPTKELTSILFDQKGIIAEYTSEKIETNNRHGSGCTLSSAIAAYLAQGKKIPDAVNLAQQYVHEAIKEGADVAIGKGNGPLNHFFAPQQLLKRKAPL